MSPDKRSRPLASSAPSASEADAPLLKRRWVRVGAGIGLAGLCTMLAVAAMTMPFLEITSGSTVHAVGGGQQSGNLHLVLMATGVIGSALGLYYAASQAALRASFFVVGGVGAGFSGLILIGALQAIGSGTISDPKIYAAVKHAPVEMQVGTGLWTSLAAAAGILLLAVIVLRAGAPLPQEEETPNKRRF